MADSWAGLTGVCRHIHILAIKMNPSIYPAARNLLTHVCLKLPPGALYN